MSELVLRGPGDLVSSSFPSSWAWLILCFVFGLSPAPTLPEGAPLGLAGDGTEGCLSTGRDRRGSRQMPTGHIGKLRHGWKPSRLGVCVWFGLMLCVLLKCLTHSLLASSITLGKI